MKAMDHLEKIIEIAKKNGLKRKFFKLADLHLEAVGKLTHTTPKQTAIFALFLERHGEYSVAIHELADSLKCNTIQMIRYMDEIDVLKKKKLLRPVSRYSNDGSKEYVVPLTVVDTLRKGKEYLSVRNSNLTPVEFFDAMDDLCAKFEDDEFDKEVFISELTDLCNNNNNICFTKMLKKYKISEDSRLIMIMLCNAMVNMDKDKIELEDFNKILDPGPLRDLKRSLKSKEHELYKHGFIDFEFSKGLFDTKYCIITRKAKDEFLSDIELADKNKDKNKSFIVADKIKAKKLFYSLDNERQILDLTKLLREENFKNIQNRLSENSMRTGFACIFSGPPGTGKTETAYQIARETGRDIMFVNISETKSCWFGESEKLIKEVFERYRNYVKKEDKAPILLFNEADAVLGKRREISDSSGGVDQTENAIQNIILQEMEDLNGILIATTNMTKNLDKAFERRFLYKIEFAKPNTEAKKLIWQSLIPDLSESDAVCLADQFDFSGGQIENISRKSIVSFILEGKKPDLADLQSMCKEEHIEKTAVRLGFI